VRRCAPNASRTSTGLDTLSVVTTSPVTPLAGGTAEPGSCCPALSAGALSRAEAAHLAARLKALADPARLQVLAFLRAQPDGEACACHFTELLGLSQPTVSHHLKVLHDAGLLTREKRGPWVHYALASDALAAVRAALA
jgi:ArsR family transcriptional regulator